MLHSNALFHRSAVCVMTSDFVALASVSVVTPACVDWVSTLLGKLIRLFISDAKTLQLTVECLQPFTDVSACACTYMCIQRVYDVVTARSAKACCRRRVLTSRSPTPSTRTVSSTPTRLVWRRNVVTILPCSRPSRRLLTHTTRSIHMKGCVNLF